MTASLSSIVHKYVKAKVLVIGDPMMDIYHFGRVDRISQEAPVPVFVEERQKGRPGGAANVACNVEALGAKLDSVFPRSHTEKHRFMVGHQQIFRRDIDVIVNSNEQDVEKAKLKAKDCDVIVLSDYAKGWLTHEMCQAAIAAGKPVIVDPKGSDWSKYKGCSVICPNEKEVVLGQFSTGGDMVLKVGPRGLLVMIRGEPSVPISATAKQVFDVTGAGDTVVATLACSIAVGASLYEAAVLANHAAGVVVGKVGTSVCTKEELLACV